jgi:hypothetical protein
MRRIAFYTFRHLGIATPKRTMPAEEVAACAGHASVPTAGRYYAKSRHGWMKMRSAGPPSPASLALVRWPKSPSQMLQPKEEVPVWLCRVDRTYGHR